MKDVQACLSARQDVERSFHHCGGPVKLIQACLCAENTLQRCFNRRGGTVKHVQACLSASKDGESSFHYCGFFFSIIVLSLLKTRIHVYSNIGYNTRDDP